MADIKTKVNEASIDTFLTKTDEETRKDCYKLIGLMEKVTGESAKMWGSAIIGCGQYHYKYESGHEGDMCRIGFSPRVGKLALYIGAVGQDELLAKLGKYKTGKGCLYLKKLDDVNLEVLGDMMQVTLKALESKYPK